MKKKIHPKYVEATVTCGCGETFQTRSTKEKIVIGICSKCHPFFTGKQKFVDTAGQVEKFQKKFQWSEDRAKTEEKRLQDERRKAEAHKRNIGAHKREQEEARTRLRKAAVLVEKALEEKEKEKGPPKARPRGKDKAARGKDKPREPAPPAGEAPPAPDRK